MFLPDGRVLVPFDPHWSLLKTSVVPFRDVVTESIPKLVIVLPLWQTRSQPRHAVSVAASASASASCLIQPIRGSDSTSSVASNAVRASAMLSLYGKMRLIRMTLRFRLRGKGMIVKSTEARLRRTTGRPSWRPRHFWRGRRKVNAARRQHLYLSAELDWFQIPPSAAVPACHHASGAPYRASA